MLLVVPAAARVLLLLCCCYCCCFFDDDYSCFLTFGHISDWYDISRARYYYCIYLLSMQSPAPASSLAEPPPAASPHLGPWTCQQGLRTARIRGLLLVLAAVSAAAASTTAALSSLFTFGHISYWYGRIVTTITAQAGTGFASHCMPGYE